MKQRNSVTWEAPTWERKKNYFASSQEKFTFGKKPKATHPLAVWNWIINNLTYESLLSCSYYSANTIDLQLYSLLEKILSYITDFSFSLMRLDLLSWIELGLNPFFLLIFASISSYLFLFHNIYQNAPSLWKRFSRINVPTLLFSFLNSIFS